MSAAIGDMRGTAGADPPPNGGNSLKSRVAGRLRELLHPGQFSRGVLALIAGTGAGQVVVLVTSPIITRLYGPLDFGVYAFATSVLGILIAVSCLAYDNAIPLPQSDDEAANVLALCLALATVFGIASLLVLLVAGPTLLALLGASMLAPLVVLLAVGQLGGAVVGVFRKWAIRTRSYGEIAANQLVQTATLALVQIWLGMSGAGAPGLVAGAVAGSAVGSGRLGRVAWSSHAASFRRTSPRGVRIAASRYRRFPTLAAPSALLNAFGLQMPLFMIVALYGAAIGGEFALAQRVAALPATLITGAVGQVYFAEAAALLRRDADLRGVFARTTRSVAAVAVGPIAVIGVVSPFVFGPVFGEDWRQAGIFVAILAPMYYVYFVSNPTGNTLDVLQRQDLTLVRETLRIALLAGAAMIAALAHLPPEYGVAAISIAGCVTYVVYGGLSWIAIIVAHNKRASAAVVSAAVEPGEGAAAMDNPEQLGLQ